MNVLSAQTRLKQFEFDPGPIDGIPGRKTWQAFADFLTSRKAPADAGAALATWLPVGAINTRLRVIHFLAQICHESGFVPRAENLNYSTTARLQQVWPSRFASAIDAANYVRNPEKLANRVYADRMGNGDEASGDGWRYRGRGWIQLTGRANYEAFGLSGDPDALLTTDGAAKSAVLFWGSKHLNTLAEADDAVTITKRINGGTVGLSDRLALVERLKAIWPS